jgi:hypothetical protein
MWTPLFATSATLCMSHSHSTKFSLSNLLAAALGSNEPHLVIEALKVIEEWSDMKQSEENDDESSPLAVRSLVLLQSVLSRHQLLVFLVFLLFLLFPVTF